MKSEQTILIFLTIVMSSFANSQARKATDYLNIQGPILFDKQTYNLNRSTHPATIFYKQKYIIKGENADKFKTMILTDVVTCESNIKNVVGAKVEELKRMKKENPAVNYEIIQNPKTDEYILDFLLSANTANGTMSIVEGNVYRYKTFTDKAGHQGVQLFGVSTRGYGAETDKFFASLKANRKDLIDNVSKFLMSQIKI